jgi:periplasmic protein CpxP/Spy
MKNSILKSAVPTLFALAFLTPSAWAQDAAAPGPGTPPAAAPAAPAHKHGHEDKHEDFVEQRVKELHAQLQITDQQSQQWEAFAQTMRDNAKKADQAFHDRAQKIPSLNADEAMKSYADLAQMHAENMQKLAGAFSGLYGVLSDDQKKTADRLFRNEAAKRRQERHKMPQ